MKRNYKVLMVGQLSGNIDCIYVIAKDLAEAKEVAIKEFWSIINIEEVL